jgi:hypothetical protein
MILKKTTTICILMALYALYLRVDALWHRELWNDEVYQFLCMNAPKAFWLHNTYGDHTSFPGGYLINYPFILLFGTDKWGLAIPHLISAAAGLFLLYKLCTMYFKTTSAYIIAFLIVAWNGNLIFHALEFRPYAVLPTLALGSLYFAEFIARNYARLSLKQKMAVGLFYVFTVVYHAYGILIFILPVGYVFCSLWQRQSRFPADFFKFFLTIAFVAFPLWAWYASSNAFGLKAKSQGQSMVETFQYIPDPAANPIGFLKGIVGNLMGTKKLYVLLLGIITAMLVPHARKFEQFNFLALLIALPIALILWVDLRSHYWFLQRQFVWVMPLFALWLAWCWDVTIGWLTARFKGGAV